jgi:hypothetical protein
MLSHKENQQPTAYQSDEEPDLLRGAAGCGVGDGPSGFLAGLELSFAQNIDKNGEDIGIDHGLSNQEQNIKWSAPIQSI